MWTRVHLSWHLPGRQVAVRVLIKGGLQWQQAATLPSSSRCRQQPQQELQQQQCRQQCQQQQSQQQCRQQCQQGLLLHTRHDQGAPHGPVQQYAGCCRSGASVRRETAAPLTTQAATQVPHSRPTPSSPSSSSNRNSSHNSSSHHSSRRTQHQQPAAGVSPRCQPTCSSRSKQLLRKTGRSGWTVNSSSRAVQRRNTSGCFLPLV